MKKKLTMYILFVSVTLNFLVSNVGVEGAFAAGNQISMTVEGAIVAAVEQQQTSVDLYKYKIKKDEISDIYYSIYYNNPSLFVANYNTYTYDSNGYVTKIGLTYNYTKSQAKTMNEALENERDKILSGIRTDMTDVQKALYVHDYFAINYEYDYDVYQGGSGDNKDYSAYGVMVEKKGVCMGYALAYVYVMEALDIETSMVTSDSMNHAWNMVKINGKYYHIDIVWDDKVCDTSGYACHENFLLSDDAIEKTGHYGWKTDGVASSTIYDNYFWKDVYSAFVYYNNNCYYVDTSDRMIKQYNIKTNTSANIYSLENEKWGVFGRSGYYYTGCYAKLAVVGNKLYFNTSDKIYSLNPVTKKASLVFTASAANLSTGYIYGIANQNDRLIYQIKRAMGSSYLGKIYTVSNVNSYAVTSLSSVDSQKVSIQEAAISLSSLSYTYNGSAKKPSVTVRYENKTLTNGTDYTVSYVNNIYPGTAAVTITGKGDYEGSKTATFSIIMPKVSNLKATGNKLTQLSLGWTKLNNVSGYVVQRYNASKKAYETIKTLTSNTASYTDTKLSSSGSYIYRVRPYVKVSGSNVYGSFSSAVTTFTTKAIVSNVKISALGSKKIKLTWNKFSLATGYQIQRATSKNGTYSTVKKITSSSTVSFTNTNLTKGKTYYYRIRAYRTVGGVTIYSGWSSVKSIKCK